MYSREKKHSFQTSLFRGRVHAVRMRAPRWQPTQWPSLEPPLLSPAADSVSVREIPVPDPNPQAPARKGFSTHSFSCLDKDQCSADSLPGSPERKKKLIVIIREAFTAIFHWKLQLGLCKADFPLDLSPARQTQIQNTYLPAPVFWSWLWLWNL